VGDLILRQCSFETPRLSVEPWHAASSSAPPGHDLAEIVADMLTENVTRTLPAGWQGSYTRERAGRWVEAQDREGTTLLIRSRQGKEALGLVMLFIHSDQRSNCTELRLGYLLAEHAWGRGLATELLAGLVEWCRQHEIDAIVGGVARDNLASRHVLEKCGFTRDEPPNQSGVGVVAYRLILSQTKQPITPHGPTQSGSAR
jgi:RimJ/RimL family protein N-acetyltransferase